ncbi:MAG: aromatic acid/H+ symport family MFS transporter [Neisseria sp.]|uniref:MFS transporter n=1 Tax=Neisseria sp. TaxID=192066 RepID=UPI0026DCC5FD|nr:aromatic acid/H+ symport family MFS transporter [Neisseria sp.]MDO4640871.1 aromatic acid/H+ symport family MFS transporter [Neisseria sp.]
MTHTHEINIRTLLDNRPVGRYQKLVIFLCFLIVVMDGFDVAIMGFVAPSLKEAWHLSNNALAPVLSAALAGLSIGALIAGPLADRFGRRKVLIANVLTFGLFTLLVATADTLDHMVAYRFIAGCAMGGIMPNAATLATEFSPARSRALLVTIVFAGFTVGAAGGGFLAAGLIPHLGWHSVFWVGGISPLLLSLVLWALLPESIGFLVHKSGETAHIRKIVEKCAPNTTTEHSTFTLPLPPKTKGNPIKTVLNSHYRIGSILIWSAYFMHLFLVYLLGSWMPTMLKESGMTAAQASIISAMFQLGGPLGSVLLGWLMDRFNPNRVLGFAYLTGAAMLVLISNIGQQYALLCLLAFIIGAALNGGGTGMNALSSMFFPLPARATGNGWMHGLGRIGAFLSAFVGAWLLDWGWNFSEIAIALTLPAIAITLLLAFKSYYYRRRNTP